MGMGSIEEDDLIRMVRDFIESESPSSTTFSSSDHCHTLSHQSQHLILQDVLRSTETRAECKVLKHVLKHMKCPQKDTTTYKRSTRSMRNWLVMSLKMDGLHASLYQTSWPTSLGCPAGEYEYIEVMIDDEDENGKKVRLIVDIDFKSQFEVAKPTQYYRDMIDSLPVIFVGSENKLCKIISMLCCAAKQSLRQKGMHVPPWRTISYMQSKWFSGIHHHHHHHQHENHNMVAQKHGAPEGGVSGIIGNKWVPPMVKPKKKIMDMASAGGGSALSCQLSNININFCQV